MVFVATAVSAVAMAQSLVAPVLWLHPNGQVLINGQAFQPKVRPGTRPVKLNGIVGYDFNGDNGGLLLGDAPALRLNGSITVSTWINLRSYVNQGPGAQILFRGDDRSGHDPYTLAIHGDGTVNFAVQNENDRGRNVTAEIPLETWVHVLGNYDVNTGRLEIWLDGELVGTAKTQYRPFANLDKGWAPGVSIGNVQNDTGPHNQPLNGMVADLRVYPWVFRPKDLEIDGGGWFEPPVARHR